MNSDEFLRRIAEIRVWRQDGQRAPHKPLLLLLALGRLSRGKPRLASYTHEIRQPLSRLLDRFGPPRRANHPEHPFWRLRNDNLWEVPDDETLPTTSSGDVLSSALAENGTHGGFPEPLQRLLRRNPELVETATAHLLAANFPDSLHLSIRDEVGLPAGMVLDQFPAVKPVPQRRRDPNFRPAVLTAYERRCAICDFDVRLAEDLLGLDAAHIKWHAAGGPDRVPNGLALCKLHHHALDRGAIGLAPSGNRRFKLLVSQELSGTSEAFRQLVDARGRTVRMPQERSQIPDGTFVDWHRREVFRGEPRSS